MINIKQKTQNVKQKRQRFWNCVTNTRVMQTIADFFIKKCGTDSFIYMSKDITQEECCYHTLRKKLKVYKKGSKPRTIDMYDSEGRKTFYIVHGQGDNACPYQTIKSLSCQISNIFTSHIDDFFTHGIKLDKLELCRSIYLAVIEYTRHSLDQADIILNGNESLLATAIEDVLLREVFQRYKVLYSQKKNSFGKSAGNQTRYIRNNDDVLPASFIGKVLSKMDNLNFEKKKFITELIYMSQKQIIDFAFAGLGQLSKLSIDEMVDACVRFISQNEEYTCFSSAVHKPLSNYYANYFLNIEDRLSDEEVVSMTASYAVAVHTLRPKKEKSYIWVCDFAASYGLKRKKWIKVPNPLLEQGKLTQPAEGANDNFKLDVKENTVVTIDERKSLSENRDRYISVEQFSSLKEMFKGAFESEDERTTRMMREAIEKQQLMQKEALAAIEDMKRKYNM